MKRLFLVDGTALVFRSFHAFSGRAQLTSRGRNVGMVYGFLSSLLSILRREKPDLLVLTFDTGAPTFRHKMFEPYKANRPPLDEDLAQQIPTLYEIIAAMNIPQIALDGWEADDVVGTLAKRAETAGMEVFLVSGDKDFYQLVTDKVKVYTLPRQSSDNPSIYDPDGIESKFGVRPEKVIDVLGLMGDSSDNIPGIPKIGPKTAVNLVREYGGLEEVLSAADRVKQKKLSENLTEFADQARLSYKLVTIDTDVPVDLDLDKLTFGPINNPAARSLLTDLEFSRILDQLDKLEPENAQSMSPDKIKRNYHTVTDPEKLD
ncbi:MAG TPA: DNA polymerase I, partial [Bacteroidetes bacterium]|nr:DNA polymerase I [Bacteroidota bacterium]